MAHPFSSERGVPRDSYGIVAVLFLKEPEQWP
jgi:hypothetical protein